MHEVFYKSNIGKNQLIYFERYILVEFLQQEYIALNILVDFTNIRFTIDFSLYMFFNISCTKSREVNIFNWLSYCKEEIISSAEYK